MISNTGAFDRAWDATITEFGSHLADYGFPSTSDPGPALTLDVLPYEGPEWVGNYSTTRAYRGVTGAFGTPSPTHICFAARGTAYLSDVLDPATTTCLELGGPVREIVELPKERLLLLGTPWKVTALGHGSIAWITNRISVETLRLDEVLGHYVLGVADEDDDEPREFAIDLRTGHCQGGSA